MRAEVLSVREMRERLPRVLEKFRQGDRHPVFLGSHRRTEAVMLPVEVYDELIARDNAAAQALSSLRVEAMAPSPRAAFIIERWVRGEIDTDAMEREIKALHGISD